MGFLDVLDVPVIVRHVQPDQAPALVERSTDLKRLGDLDDRRFMASQSAPGILYVDSLQAPPDQRWLVPLASARFSAPDIPALPAKFCTMITWCLCDPTRTPRSETFAPPPALIRDTISLFDTDNRPFPIAASADSFFRSPDGTSIYGLSTIGGLHNQELKIPPRWFLRVVLSRNDAGGPNMPAGTTLELNMQVFIEHERVTTIPMVAPCP